MKNPIIIIALALLSGCVSSQSYETESLYKQATRSFTYEHDIANEYRIYGRIDQQFKGDCEDFAFTLQKQIGGDVYFTYLNGTEPHAVLSLNGKVYDMDGIARPIKDYPGKLLFIMTYEDPWE
jgi:hypothetical protein